MHLFLNCDILFLIFIFSLSILQDHIPTISMHNFYNEKKIINKSNIYTFIFLNYFNLN